MTEKELSTYQNFINTNNSFSYALENNTPIKPNIYLKVELLILHIRHKCSNFCIPISNKILIQLLNGNFYIEDDHIIIEEKHYTIEDLYSMSESLNSSIAITMKPIPIRLSTTNKEPTTGTKQCRVINIMDRFPKPNFTLEEREIIFERTCRIDEETLPYIREMRYRFIEVVDSLIPNILNETIDYDEETYYKIIASYLKLYPFAGYAANKTNIPYENINLPLNEIGLTKIKYNDAHLESIKRRVKELNKVVKKISQDTETIISSNVISNKRLIDSRNRRTIFINAEIASLLFEYNEYSHNPEVLNKLFFESIYEALIKGNIIINHYFLDPVIKLFTIKNGEVTSFIAIHLTTLLNIIDSNILSSKDTKKLEIPVN